MFNGIFATAAVGAAAGYRRIFTNYTEEQS